MGDEADALFAGFGVEQDPFGAARFRERPRAGRKVDVDERPDLAKRSRIAQVPSLALVKGRRVVARLEGRSTAPKIESLLDSHVREGERERERDKTSS